MEFTIIGVLLLKVIEVTVIIMVIKGWQKKRENNQKKGQKENQKNSESDKKQNTN
jgi:FtsZ-interacting cell division protein ZipA